MFCLKRFSYSMIFILLAATCRGQQFIPSTIAVPIGTTIVLHVYAKGVQIYRCTQDVKDTSQYIWTFQEPQANLFNSVSYIQKIGKHYLSTDKNPAWELSDGSIISGIKLQQASSPDGGSIPWLLLHAVAKSGKGSLEQIVFIQRLYTHGGKAPEKVDSSQKGQVLQVPYTAEYLFYK